MWAIFMIFKKLPKVNNHPMAEISPNLVTLLTRYLSTWTVFKWQQTKRMT
jgi:hypothetical protein